MSAADEEYPKGYVAADRYEVVVRLGAGGMGSVYEAFDTKVERKVAIKFLAKELVNNTDLRKRFEREAKAAGRIDHDNVCTVSDWGLTDDGVPFLVMELLKGESLSDRLRRLGKLPVDQAIELMTEVLSALAAAHVQGIVHRDLKPDNIFLNQTSDGRERVKLVDFGIAKFIGGSGTATAHGALLGTLAYMSPEQAKGRASEIDHRTDIWAAGVILYEALTGIAPFGRETMAESLAAIINDDPAPVHMLDPSIPESVGLTIQHSMSKWPNERFGSAIEFAASLRGEPIATAQMSAYAAGAGSVSGSGVSTLPNRDVTGPQPFANSNVTVPATMVTSSGTVPSKLWLVVGAAIAGVVVLVGVGIAVAVGLSSDGETTTTVAAPPPPPPPSPPEAPTKASQPPEPEQPQESQEEVAASTPASVELRLQGLPEGSTVSFNGAPVQGGVVTGTAGQTGDLVVEAPEHATLRMPLALVSSGELDISDRLRPIAAAVPEAPETSDGHTKTTQTTARRETDRRTGSTGSQQRTGSYATGRSRSKVILDYGSEGHRSGGYARGRDRTKVSLDYPSQ